MVDAVQDSGYPSVYYFSIASSTSFIQLIKKNTGICNKTQNPSFQGSSSKSSEPSEILCHTSTKDCKPWGGGGGKRGGAR
jgi:hypothetical protein